MFRTIFFSRPTEDSSLLELLFSASVCNFLEFVEELVAIVFLFLQKEKYQQSLKGGLCFIGYKFHYEKCRKFFYVQSKNFASNSLPIPRNRQKNDMISLSYDVNNHA